MSAYPVAYGNYEPNVCAEQLSYAAITSSGNGNRGYAVVIAIMRTVQWVERDRIRYFI